MKSKEYTEAEVQQILARAVQLDTTPPDRLGEDQLRTIAAELGVSQTALDRALVEHSSAADSLAAPASSAALSVHRAWYRRPGPVLTLVAAVAFAAAVIGSRLVVEEPAVHIDVGSPAPSDVRAVPTPQPR